MEFRCSECGHIGPADGVRQEEEGVHVVCSQCGAESPLDVEASGEDEGDDRLEEASEMARAADGVADSSGPSDTFDSKASSKNGPSDSGLESEDEMRLSEKKALDRLVPTQSDGSRCPKCAKPVSEDLTHCPRCGLDLREASRYEEGEAPWEQPPPGQEEAHERAHLLWEAFAEEDDPANLDRFVDFVEEEGLYEMGIRRLRFYLVDRPEFEPALDALRQLAVGVQSRIASAQAKAEVNAEALNEDIQDLKRKLIGAVIVVWILALVLFVQIFW